MNSVTRNTFRAGKVTAGQWTALVFVGLTLWSPCSFARPGTTERVSRTYDGTTADGSSTHPKLSGDGRMVVFGSTASKILPGDNNDQEDVFVHDQIGRAHV